MKTNVRGLSPASYVAIVALAATLTWTPASPAEILRKAAAAMRQAAGKIDPDDPTRPAYHYLPTANWMNDICGTIYHDGWYHLFYLQNPFGDCFSRFVVWGHARSRDLVHWQRLGLTLPPSPDKGELACYTGAAAVNKNAAPMIFYTVQPQRRGAQRTVGLALGDKDLLRWRKYPHNPLLVRGKQGDPKFAGGWDAPFVFQDRGRTFMILGAILGDRSVVPIYEATDEAFLKWTYRGILFGISRKKVRDLECANFLKLGDRWMLTYSPDNSPMRYFVGPFDPDTCRFDVETQGVLDHSYGRERHWVARGFYASNVLIAPDGRRILFGWVAGFRDRKGNFHGKPGDKPGRGWNGCVSLPRVITLGKDRRPRQHPAAELKTLRGAGVHKKDLHVDGEHLLDTASGDTLEVVAELATGRARAVGLKLRRSADGRHAAVIRWDGKTVDVAGTKVALDSPAGATLQVHAFLDRSLLEVFLDGGREVVCRTVPVLHDGRGVAVFSEGGRAAAKTLDVWQIKPIWKKK